MANGLQIILSTVEKKLALQIGIQHCVLAFGDMALSCLFICNNIIILVL